jgi:MATE family multidrug resistance protein
MCVNIALDYVWIFGKFGFPALGIEGAGWATVAAYWFEVAVYLALMFRKEVATTYRLWETRRLEGWLMRRLIVYGAPAGLQFLIEGGAFTLIIMKMREAGDEAMAASTLAFSLNAMAFVPIVGLGIAVSTLVGQQLTGGRPELAERATWTAIGLALMYTLVFGVVYVLTPDLLLAAYALGGDPAEFAHLREITIVLLRFVAAYCLFDALQIIFLGAIKGAGDTWFVFGNAIVVSVLAVTIGWIGGELGGGLYWWWGLLTGWIWLLGVIYLLRFLQGRWRTMRVIEHDFTDPDEPRTAHGSLAPEGDAA